MALFLRGVLLELKREANEHLNIGHITVDSPIYFSMDTLLERFKHANETTADFGKTKTALTGKFDQLLVKLQSRMNDTRYDFLLRPKKRTSSESLAGLLRDFVGLGEQNAKVTVLDLSSVPFDVHPTVTAQVGRLAFEFNFWNPQCREFPLFLVAEEAHSYIPRITATGHQGTRRSIEERRTLGKSLRKHVPRTGHAAWSPGSARPDPIGLLEEQNKNRLDWLVPVRRGRMMASPFAFYRGGARVMAADLQATPVTGLTVQACGDAHLANFGLFASPERELVFDLNDFDETLEGPWEWDLKRLAASFMIAARHNQVDHGECRKATGRVVQSYREAMNDFAAMRTTDIWYALLKAKDIVAWADSRRGYHIQLVRQHLLAAAEEPDHDRDWRPVILAFSRRPERRARLLKVAEWLEGRSGMTTLDRTFRTCAAMRL